MAEDEPMLAEPLCWALEDADFEVITAENGDAAVPLLVAMHVDVLVTGIRISQTLDDWALAGRARQLQPDLPAAFVSGYSPNDPALPSRRTFLQKFFAPEALLSAVEAIM